MNMGNPTVQQMLDVFEYANCEICDFWGEPIDEERFTHKELMSMTVESAWPIANMVYIYTWVDESDNKKAGEHCLTGEEWDKELEKWKEKTTYKINLNCNYSLNVRADNPEDAKKILRTRFANSSTKITEIVDIRKTDDHDDKDRWIS